MTSNFDCLVLGASLSTAYRNFVVEHPDVKSALIGIEESFQRFGHEPTWSKPPTLPLAPYEDGKNCDLFWILKTTEPKNPADKDERAAAELNKIVHSINQQAAPHAINLVNRFRRGEWIAHGVKEPPNHDLERAIIQPDWWQRNDGVVDFAQGVLSRKVLDEAANDRRSKMLRYLIGWKNVEQFSMILAIDAFPERRVSPGSDLLGAVDALADLPDIYGLHKARSGTDKAFEDLDQRLRGELFSLLQRDRLRLSRHDQTPSDLNWVRKDALEDAELNFEESTLTSAGIKNAPVLVHPVKQQAPVSIDLTQEIKRRELRKTGKPGPQSREEEIIWAFESLLAQRAIDPFGSKVTIYRQVRQKVIETSDSVGSRGLSNSTIETYIAILLEEAKAKHSQNR